MRLPDTNVLLYAVNRDAPQQAVAERWLTEAFDSPAGAGLAWVVLLGFIRIATRPGIFAFWGNDGTVSHEDAKTCIRLMGEEVLPAVREMAKEFDLKSPFETGDPVSVEYMPGRQTTVRAAAE